MEKLQAITIKLNNVICLNDVILFVRLNADVYKSIGEYTQIVTG